jgi:endonuclease YncB( thermonuclease family)
MKFFLSILAIYSLCCAADAKPPKILHGTALWIVDGDTVLLRRGSKITSIRLWGIDAPEKKQIGGRAATRHLIKLIGRKRIKVVTTCIDKYGRSVGKIYYKGRLINLEMVKAGHAWWNERYCPEAKEIEKAEKNARKNKYGLWKNPNPLRPEYFRHPERIHPQKTVQDLRKINCLYLQIFCCIRQMTFYI